MSKPHIVQEHKELHVGFRQCNVQQFESYVKNTKCSEHIIYNNQPIHKKEKGAPAERKTQTHYLEQGTRRLVAFFDDGLYFLANRVAKPQLVKGA